MLLLLCCFLTLGRGALVARDAGGVSAQAFEPMTALSVDRAVRDGAAWYQHRLTRLRGILENPADPAAVEQGLDALMEVFCQPPDFKRLQGARIQRGAGNESHAA
jgi:hypothetical protein